MYSTVFSYQRNLLLNFEYPLFHCAGFYLLAEADFNLSSYYIYNSGQRSINTLMKPFNTHLLKDCKSIIFPFRRVKKTLQNLTFLFSSKKSKQNNNQGSQKQRYLSEKMKEGLKLRKEVLSMEVPSQAELQSTYISSQIKRQRAQLEQNQKDRTIEEERTVLQQFLLVTTGLNLGVSAFLFSGFLSKSYYYLGIYSSLCLYPSFLAVACASVGTNLGYLIFRQALKMYLPVQEIKNIQLTSSPPTYYLQMKLISLQLFSLAGCAGIPFFVQHLPDSYKNIVFSLALLSLLAVNAHSSYQQKEFKSKLYKISIHSYCFLVLFVLCFYIESQFSGEEEKGKQLRKGQAKIREVWRIKKYEIQKEQKITDFIVSKQQQKREKKKPQRLTEESVVKIWGKE